MAPKITYTGINIQYPITQMILSSEKIIETRKYPIPKAYIGQKMVIIETPGKAQTFKARMVGFVTFGESFRYASKSDFYRDTKLHCVTPESTWRWIDGEPKYGWPINSVESFARPLPLQKKSGIKFSKGIVI